LPFKCPFCGRYFCSEHRLPENHGCPEIWRVFERKDGQELGVGGMLDSQQEYHDYRIPASPLGAKSFGVSATELKHLTLGTLIVVGVGFSFFLQEVDTYRSGLYILASAALVFISTFILHEVAHKIAAQRYGLWAEFRLTLLGTLLTLFSIVSPLKIISPGVVEIAGVADKKTIGKVSIAGPMTNMILSVVFLALDHYTENPFMLVGAFLNSWTTLFNLIPFSVLDGEKIFRWDRKVWAVSFALSIMLTYLALRISSVLP